MPTLFEIFGLRFFFFSSEHLPIHVHVQCGDGEAKIDLEPGVKLVYNYGLKANDLRRALDLAGMYREEIIERWHKFHD